MDPAEGHLVSEPPESGLMGPLRPTGEVRPRMVHDDHPELPLDPDAIEAYGRPRQPRPAHHRPLLWVVVFLGGASGTAARHQFGLALQHGSGGWPLSTLVVNVAGSLVLGVLLEALVRGGPDAGWRRMVRLAGGTGFCGGLTTYSSLAVEVTLLGRNGHWPAGAGYAAVSVLAGLVAAATGIAVATGWHRGQPRPSVDRPSAVGRAESDR